MQVSINILTDGEVFLDMLKAVIREWYRSPWEHERQRARYALTLYQQALNVYQEYLAEARTRAESGYNTDVDRRLVSDMETRLAYWQKKLAELTGAGMEGEVASQAR